MGDTYTVLIEISEQKHNRPFGRPKRRWDDIEVDLKEAGCDSAD
jgi:hypothetical protein